MPLRERERKSPDVPFPDVPTCAYRMVAKDYRIGLSVIYHTVQACAGILKSTFVFSAAYSHLSLYIVLQLLDSIAGQKKMVFHIMMNLI